MCVVCLENERTRERENKRTREQENKRTREQENERTREQENKRTREQENESQTDGRADEHTATQKDIGDFGCINLFKKIETRTHTRAQGSYSADHSKLLSQTFGSGLFLPPASSRLIDCTQPIETLK